MDVFVWLLLTVVPFTHLVKWKWLCQDVELIFTELLYVLETNELAPTKQPSANFTPFLIVQLIPKKISEPVVCTDPPNAVFAAMIFLGPIKQE